MVFQFSLETVLRLRRSEQQQQEMTLQRLSEQANRIEVELQAIDDQIRRLSRQANSERGTTGAEIHFDQERCEIFRQRRNETEGRLLVVRQQQAVAVKQFHRTWQRREALESLQQRQHQAYDLEEVRKEQRSHDDLFLQRKRKG
jgi:flagellar export protein FliJ